MMRCCGCAPTCAARRETNDKGTADNCIRGSGADFGGAAGAAFDAGPGALPAYRQWQASYATPPSELTSDLLVLRDDKAQLLLADWSPTAAWDWRQVTFNMTCPAELLQVSTVEETAETQPAEPVLVTLSAVDKNLQAETKTSYTVSDDVANITVALKLTAQTVPQSPVAVCMPIRVELAGAADIWFGGNLSFTLCPGAEDGSSAVA